MRNFLEEKPKFNSLPQNAKDMKRKLKISDLEVLYLNSMKTKCRYGLEYERLSLDKNTGKCAEYDSVAKIIENFCAITGWEIVYDENTIIGAKSADNCSLSLEPGYQFEISIRPYENIADIDFRLNKILNSLDKIADLYGVIFLPYAINPTQTPDEIRLLNKRRYKIMNNYLPNCARAELCTSMMRKTAGIQVNIDYSDKKDAYLKLKFFNLIAPFVSGLMSNSPFENNNLTENKSNRANVWLYTGQNRCNIFYEDIFGHKFGKFNNIFKNYIDNLLDIPMVYIERNDEYIPVNGLITFREFMKDGFMDYSATFDDFMLHQSLCFPDVRLKQYIEIRNHDTNKPEYALGLCALYKGLSKCSFEKLLNKFKFLKLNMIEQNFKNSIKCGLDFKINQSQTGWDIVSELLNIARKKLNTKERCYLEPLIEMINRKKTTADIIINKNIKSANELIKCFY